MTDNDQVRLHAIVYGRVQGVGFRDATRRRARDLGLVGWVRNESDGTVETVAEGDRETLERFLAFLNRGPSSAQVRRVDAEWSDASSRFGDFSVR